MKIYSLVIQTIEKMKCITDMDYHELALDYYKQDTEDDMLNINQFAIYQLKAIPENHKIKFRPYAVVQALDVQIRSSSYDQVYLGTTFPEDSPNLIYERFLKNPPKKICRS